jgi:hypothetical protein
MFSVGEATRLALTGLHDRSQARSGDTQRLGSRALQGSIEAGTFEDAFFAVPVKGETDHLLRVARRTLDAGRRLRRDARGGHRILTATERTIAALTSAAVRIYEEILTLARLNRGRVFPSYEHLANATGLGRATVARALPILEAIGFLTKQRRFRRVATENGRPRYAQTSNVYRALLPTRVLPYLPRWLRPAPIPCNEAQRCAEDAIAYRTLLATLSCRELAETTIEGPIGKALAMLGAGIDRHRCESQNGPEPLTNFI